MDLGVHQNNEVSELSSSVVSHIDDDTLCPDSFDAG
jgi:hypothetical protein